LEVPEGVPRPKAMGRSGNEANSRARKETDPTPSEVEGEGNAQFFIINKQEVKITW
jgi:hypothetical protein